MIRWMLVVTQAICSMAGESEPVAREQDPARLRLLDDPDIVVESLLDGGAVGLPEGHHLEAHPSEGPGQLEAAEAEIDEEGGGLLRRLPAAACRRHG